MHQGRGIRYSADVLEKMKKPEKSCPKWDSGSFSLRRGILAFLVLQAEIRYNMSWYGMGLSFA